jgi:pimeloyl-ACP methyl ester carboxylesterase
VVLDGIVSGEIEVFPDAEVVLLDNSGHWPFADRPDETRELVVGFLRGAVTPTR